MIKNQRQYGAARTQLAKFDEAIRTKEAKTGGSEKARMEIDALKCARLDLQEQIERYDGMKESGMPVQELESVAELPDVLVRARIASGMTQAGLAGMVGIKEQQIQRYEATGYSAASMARIKDIAAALKIRSGPGRAVEFEEFLAELGRAGIGKGVLADRMLPPRLARCMKSGEFGENPDLAKSQIIEHAAAAMGARRGRPWKTAMRERIESLNVSFKKPENASEKKVHAYAAYADCIASIAAKAAGGIAKRGLARDPITIHKSLARKGGITLGVLLDYVWDMGISVMALNDRGAFHGAYFNKNGRHVIILKQRTKSEARWMFDMLHEFWHAAEGDGVVHMVPSEDGDRAANEFAARALLGTDPGDMTSLCMRAAGNKIPGLKNAIPLVARHHDIPAPILANCVAYEAYRRGDGNIWGVAANIGRGGADPKAMVLDAFIDRSDFAGLEEQDVRLLQQAIDYGS